MSLAADVAELSAREEQLREALRALRVDLKAARLRHFEELYGLRLGSVVTYRGKEYRVTEIDAGYGGLDGKPWLMGNPRLKCGGWGTSERHLYSYWMAVPPPNTLSGSPVSGPGKST